MKDADRRGRRLSGTEPWRRAQKPYARSGALSAERDLEQVEQRNAAHEARQVNRVLRKLLWDLVSRGHYMSSFSSSAVTAPPAAFAAARSLATCCGVMALALFPHELRT